MNRLLAELDLIQAPKEKGDAFERVVKWVLQTAPQYRDQIQRTHLWSEFPRAWGPDTGIDLVCEPVEGAFWAVQAKAYAEGSSVTWRDISTFVGASAARPEVGFLLLVTTGSSVSPHALRNLKASGKRFSVLTRDSLLELGLTSDAGLKDLRPWRVERFKPREHQEEAIRSAVKGFKSHDRGQLIEACGTGKTLTALWVHEALKSNRTLVFVPSLALLAQTLREWTKHAKKPFVAFAVCSDATVTDADPMVTSVSEIGFPSTTDPKALRKALKKHEAVVVFATYQSSQVIEDALKRTKYRFDLMIADEAHRATGLGVSDFTRPLSDKHIPSDRRLFMTATPRIFGPRTKKAADDEDLLLSSMDDEEVYGPRFHTLSFSDAIERDLLTDYRVAIVGVDDEEVGDLANSKAFVTVDGTEVMDASELAAHIAVAKAMKRFGTRRMLSFHSRISRAKRFGDQLPKVIGWLGEGRRPGGEVWAEAVQGSMPVRERRQILKKLEGVGDFEYGLVSNARCLGEGVDVPSIDGIAFVDPKNSQVDIVQAVGRAIRKAETKTGLSTIVLPVFIGESEDPEETLGRSEFKTVWRVLDALRSHDNALADEFDELRRGMGRGEARPGLPPKIVFDLPRGVSPEFADALSLKLVEKTTSSWDYHLGVLERFVAREGHAKVPVSHVGPDAFKLGSWVNTQRTFHQNGKLSPERVVALEAVKGWSWAPLADQFREGLERLRAFQSREGHARIPSSHVDPDGFKLDIWVGGRRAEYRKGKLGPERTAALEAVPGWSWDPREDLFWEGLERLQAFHSREGHARVPHGHLEPDGFRLGNWVGGRRAEYQNGKLSLDRLAALEAVPGWSWDPLADQFREGLERLGAFQSREGHARVSGRHVESDGFRLGAWVNKRRSSYQKGKLSPEQVAALEAVPGWSWDPYEDDFWEGLERLRAFQSRHRHARVPSHHVEPNGFALGNWVDARRAEYGKGRLSPERIEALEAVSGWSWDPLADQFREGLERLRAFQSREGHVRVPGLYVEPDGFRLGSWVNHRRIGYQKGKLSPEQVVALESIPDWSWAPYEDDFREGLERLQAFHSREGHARVPVSHVEPDGFRLGIWVVGRRAEARKGNLSPERIGALDAVPGWSWNPDEDDFQEGLEKLRAYQAREGHARVPQSHVEPDGFRLGSWVRNRRDRRSRQTPDHVAALESIPGWSWDPLRDQLQEGLEKLRAFQLREGHARVPRDHLEPDGFKLGNWVHVCRQLNRKGGLSPERVAELEELPGWSWDPRENDFREGLERLAAFRRREGHAMVPASHVEPDGFKLGTWVHNRKAGYRKGKLTPQRVAALEAIEGWTW